MKKIYLIMLMFLLLTSLTFALEVQLLEKKIYDFDNIKSIKNIEGKQYPDITIKNNFGIGKDVWKGKLDKNTEVCTNDCSAEQTIEITEPTELISDIRFLTLKEDGSWQEQPIRSYQLYINSSVNEIEVEDYENQCSVIGILPNGTQNIECSKVLVGTHTEYTPEWIPYNIGEVLPAGLYKIKLEGEKKPSRTVDWQIKTNGEWLTEWAVWGVGNYTENTTYIPSSFSSQTSKSGVNITSKANINLTGVKKDTGNDATTAYIYTPNGTTQLATASFSGDWATFNYALTSGDSYLVVLDSGGSPYNFSSYLASYLFPKEGNFINFTNSVFNNNPYNENISTSINVINLSDGNSWVTLNSPADASTSSTNNVQFDATATINSGAYLTNMSLWTNESGSWESKNSTILFSASPITSANPTEPNVGGNSQTNKVGEKVSFNESVTISQITKVSSSDATKAYIQTSYAGSVLASASFVGDVATFNYEVSEGTDYFILVDDSGASYDAVYNNGASKPVTSGRITWKNGVNAAGAEDTTYSRVIKNITYGGSSSSTQTWNRTINDGIIWNVQACDSDGDCGFAISNYSLEIDSTPPQLTINSPINILDFGKVGLSETLNWTVTDSNLDSVWFDYNGTNITLVGASNTTTFAIESGNYNLTLWANDSVGNINSTYTNWSYKIFENFQNYSNTTINGATESFILNLNSPSSISSVNLIYNNTSYNANIDATSNPVYSMSRELIIPGFSVDTNVSFYWNIILSDATVINTSSNNQSVQFIGLDNCSTYTTILYNLTMVDEGTQDILNGTGDNTSIEIDLDIYSLDSSVLVSSINQSFSSQNPVAICTNANLTADTSYNLNALIKYQSSSREVEYYNIRNQTLDNSTLNQNITLYDLLSADSTDFQITFKNANFIALEGALIKVNRQYVSEGTFKTVELPITDSNGQTVVHLVQNDVAYNFIVTKDGQTLGTFNNLIAFCQDATIGLCTITLNAQDTGDVVFDYDTSLELSYNLDYNETTRIISLNYDISDGTTKNVTMVIDKIDQIGDTNVCSQSLSSASGTLSCTVPSSIGNETVIVEIYVDGQKKTYDYVRVGSAWNLGVGGYFILFLMIITLVMMFSESKMMVILSVIIGFISGSLLYLTKGGVLAAAGSIVWLIIAGLILMWKLNGDSQT